MQASRRRWSGLIALSVSLLFAQGCGGAEGASGRPGGSGGTDSGGEGTGGNASQAPGGLDELRFEWHGARAVAVGSLLASAPNALTAEQETLFRVEEDGEVVPALELPLGLQLPPVQFVARSPSGDQAYVSFEWPLHVPSEGSETTETGGAEMEPVGSFFRVDADGALTPLIDDSGRVLVSRPGPGADVSEGFEYNTPYHFDADGNIYVIWAPQHDPADQPIPTLVSYRPAEDVVVSLPEPEPDRVESIHAATMSADRSTLVVRGERVFPEQITDEGIPLRQLFLHLYRLPDLDAPVEVLAPTDDLAWVGGMQLSPAGDSVFFHGYRLGELSGIGRVDVGPSDELVNTLLYGMQAAHAPINHSTTHEGDYVDGFFDYSRPGPGEPRVLHWSDRWFVGGDRESGELDYEAVMASVAQLFASPVEFAYADMSGPEALQAFLADEPYSWEAIQGVPAPETFDSVYDDFYGWHFLEQHFVDASTGDPATTVASFLEAHGLVDLYLDSVYELNVREIFFDAEGALFAIVHSDWDDVAQRFRLMQPLRILDPEGNRALAVLPAVADAEFTVDAYRMGRDGRHVFVLARETATDSSDEVHRIYRFDPSLGDEAVLEDMLVNVEASGLIADFSVSEDSLYFTAAAETGGGFVDLETLEFTSFAGDAVLGAIEAF